MTAGGRRRDLYPPESNLLALRQGHPTGNFDEISVRESLPVLRLSDNALPKSY